MGDSIEGVNQGVKLVRVVIWGASNGDCFLAQIGDLMVIMITEGLLSGSTW
jgi:hypothetical protein